MNVDIFGRSQSSAVLYLCEFHKLAVASRLKVAVLIEHTPNAAGNAFGEVSAHFSEHYRRAHVSHSSHHALANRESAAAPHAHDDHRAPFWRSGLRPVFVA
jgi:hypothetical protein